MKIRYIMSVWVIIIWVGNLWAQNTGSAYFFHEDRIFVHDNAPVNPAANPSAYIFTGDALTVEAWVFPMDVPPNVGGDIVIRPYLSTAPWESYRLRIQDWLPTGDPRFEFVITDGTQPGNWGTATDPGEVNIGSWAHLAGTYDGSTVRLYVNGELVAENFYTENIGEGDTGFFIGGLDWWSYFNGLIDEVRLWDIARSQQDIQETMDTTLTGNEPGLTGYWPLDEATEVNGNFPVTVDLTDNHNDLWVDEPLFVDATANNEVNIAPGFVIEPEPLLFYYNLEQNTLIYQPVVTGWPLPVVSLINGPSGMTFDVETGTINWIPGDNQIGQHTFTLEAINTSGTVQGTYIVNLLPGYSEIFIPHTITTNADAANSVFAIDIDGDRDMDVISASGDDKKVAWYENDGNENFTPHTITTNADGAVSVYAIDVDGDEDVDVLSVSWFDNKVAWYENDGNEIFASHMISDSAYAANSVFAIDIDGDEDVDVLSASWYDDKIAWYENDGNENFTPHTITKIADGASSVYAIDVNGDGDMDVLSASGDDDKIAWYENDGNENFTPHTITDSADGALLVHAVDVDGDEDVDVLSASANDDKIAWYENDGSENFTPHIITTMADGAESVYAADVDGDENIDVISASGNDDKIAWYKNDGNENFTHHAITTSAYGAVIVYAVDVDDDGDIDVLSASYADDKIAWYENLSISSVGPNNNINPKIFRLYNNYPNPFNPTTAIGYRLSAISDVELSVYNLLGQKVATLVKERQRAGHHQVEWDASRFPSGVYYYKIQAGKFQDVKKMILIK